MHGDKQIQVVLDPDDPRWQEQRQKIKSVLTQVNLPSIGEVGIWTIVETSA